MNITVIYANGRRKSSSSYNIAQLLLAELTENGEVSEFFLPEDMPHICVGCRACIDGHEEKCGGAAAMAPILRAMDRSELIVFCTPTYAFHTPGQMKTLLDHLAYRWAVHRPNFTFSEKQAVIINTAAGGGIRSAVKDIKDSLDHMGTAKTHVIAQKVWDYDWTDLPISFHISINKKVRHTVNKIRSNSKHLKPSVKVRCIFMFYRFLHMHNKMSPADDMYWHKTFGR